MALSKSDALYLASDVCKGLAEALEDDKITKEEVVELVVKLLPVIVSRIAD